MGSAHPLVQQQQMRLPLTTLVSFSESRASEDHPPSPSGSCQPHVQTGGEEPRGPSCRYLCRP